MNADFETLQRAAFTQKVIFDAEGIAGSSSADKILLAAYGLGTTALTVVHIATATAAEQLWKVCYPERPQIKVI